MVCVDRFLALQLGLAHPSVVWAASAVLIEPVDVDLSLMIIPLANSIETISAEELRVYRDGITGSHFAVGGIDQISIPFQASSVIGD